MKQIVHNVKITGTGSYLPEIVWKNEDLKDFIEVNDQWIQENLGIKERRIAKANQYTSDLAIQAGIKALENSNLTIGDIDMIIVATATPDRLAPSTACIVQDKIKAYHAVCFDINAVCSGFLYGMAIAAQFINMNNCNYENILVIGSDTFSKITDWTKRDCVFFGDGAGAAVLSKSCDYKGYMHFQLYSDGRGKYNFTVPPGEQYFQMNGRAVYETATSVLPKAINKILKDTGLTIDDIDYMIPHQPSIKVLKKTAELVGLPFEKVLINMDRYANTSSGTIPILLDESRRAGILEDKTVLFIAVGSGWTWGVGIVEFL